ncbi:CaiB/BaiF CoA transferase family protein [Chloroflexota bacterium]
MMESLLHGIRVLESTSWMQGPAVGSMLGDLGADVIKIEDRVHGDGVRGIMPTLRAQAGAKERNYVFESVNRNKRGIAVDLHKQAGRDIVYKLIQTADIFVHNLRPDVPQTLGIDYEALSSHNPKIIYVEASGMGPEGPDRLEPSYELTIMGRTGMLFMAGEPGSPPLMPLPGLGDMIGAMVATLATIAALLARERDGIGQKVSTSLLGSLLMVGNVPITGKLLMGSSLARRSTNTMANPLWNHYKCGDDKWINLAMLQADKHWPALCRLMGIEYLEKDPRFAAIEARSKNSEELITILNGVFGTKPQEEWVQRFRESGELIYGPINTIDDAVEDPQILANRYLIDYEHPVYGLSKLLGFPYQFSEAELSVKRPAPEFGQHTEEVLVESGYTWEDIIRLKEQEVIP